MSGAKRDFHAPGRINLIGDHIDYMGGTVLPLAIDRGTDLSITPRTDRVISAFSANFAGDGVVEVELDATQSQPAWGWVNFLAAVACALREAGHELPHGYDVTVDGNIPNGAGLSSSASIELAFAVAINADLELGLDQKQLALICQAAENRFIGVACGIMDQFSIAAGKRGYALAIDCDKLEIVDVPFPENVTIIAANTSIRRELSDSGYNDRRKTCEAAEQMIAPARLVDLGPAELEALLTKLDPTSARRVRHVVSEQHRVLACIDALGNGDLELVGYLMKASHESLRDDFEVTGPQLDALVEAAWQAPGVIGARMTGAGFGGCTVNLVAPDRVDEFVAYAGERYTRASGLTADFYVMKSADGAHEIVASA